MSTTFFMALRPLYLVLGLILVTGVALAAEPEWIHPVIKNYGKVVALPQAAMQPDGKTEHKAVFNLTSGGEPDKVNGGLDRVARTVNVFASAGVPTSRLKLVVVVHGPATPIVLDNAHYREKFKTDNPNLALIEALNKAGVKVVVCGQALAHNQFAHEWVNSQVELTLSAITDLIMLEQQGYALVPL